MFTDPVKNLKAFDLRENMIVADLGAGSGFYAIPAARIVTKGKVYAIDIQKDFLTSIKNKALESHLGNIECIWGDVEKIGGTKMKDGIIDAAIVSNVLFQIEDKSNFIKEAKRILKPNGKLLFIDWSDNGSPMGPSFDKIISKEKAKEIFENEGFICVRDINTGDHHYGIIFSK